METLYPYLDELTADRRRPGVDVDCLFRRLSWALHFGMDNHPLHPDAPTKSIGSFETAQRETDVLVDEMGRYLDELHDAWASESFKQFEKLAMSSESQNEANETANSILDSYLSRRDPKRHDFLTRESYEREFGINSASS